MHCHKDMFGFFVIAAVFAKFFSFFTLWVLHLDNTIFTLYLCYYYPFVLYYVIYLCYDFNLNIVDRYYYTIPTLISLYPQSKL